MAAATVRATCRGCGRSDEVPADGWEYECLHCSGVLRPPPPPKPPPSPRAFLLAALGLWAAILLACVLVQPGPDDLVLWPSLAYRMVSPYLGLLLVVWAKVRRARWLSALLIGAAALIPGTAVPLLPHVGWWARERDLADLARRSVPLIEAIRAFENTTGAPPAALEELVPDYLTSIPSTGSWVLDDFGYWSRDGAWGFHIECPLGVLNWDEFYWPPEDDPPPWVQLIEGWGYYHE